MDERSTFKDSWKKLPPLSRWILKIMLFAGGISIAFKMGFFSWNGFLAVSSTLFIFAFIWFAIANTEQESRDMFYEHWATLKAWVKKSLGEVLAEEAKKDSKKVG